jgi:hypothetical protein
MALRREEDPPISGEPLMSMDDAARLAAELVDRHMTAALKRAYQIGKETAPILALATQPQADSAEMREAAQELLTYADLMPKKTPAAGSCATAHSFEIEAGAIWGLDLCCTKMRQALAATPATKSEAIAEAVAGERSKSPCSTCDNPDHQMCDCSLPGCYKIVTGPDGCPHVDVDTGQQYSWREYAELQSAEVARLRQQIKALRTPADNSASQTPTSSEVK